MQSKGSMCNIISGQINWAGQYAVFYALSAII